jgi:predicted SprT family Zn-dependent metalloprotease
MPDFDEPRNRPDGLLTKMGETIPTRTEAQITDPQQKRMIYQCICCREFMVVPLRTERGKRVRCRRCGGPTPMVIHNLAQET